MRLVIVGSGIVGAACAYTASRLGAEVILVDADLPGKATAAGAGIICPWSSGPSLPGWYDFACAAAREYPAMIAGLADAGADDVSYRQVGALYVPAGEADLEAASERLLTMRASAPEIGEIRILGPAEARLLFPPLRRDAAAVFIGGAARVDGRRITSALVGAARLAGAQVRSGHAALALRSGHAAPARRSGHAEPAIRVGTTPGEGGQVAGITLDGELIEADAVVAATGAWTSSFLMPAGVTVSVRPERGQIAHFSVAPADTGDWPVVLPGGSGHYLLAFDDSRVVAGATREAAAGFDYRVTPGGLKEVLTEALAVAPGLSTAAHLETRVGFRPASTDGLPLLGAARGVEGLVVATGLGASGLTLGPRTGAMAAQVALGLAPDVDLALFDPLR
jgi:D-amino-acid dehydrogenase